MNHRTKLIFELSLYIIGYAFLWVVDPRLSFGVFMIHWGMNMERGERAEDEL